MASSASAATASGTSVKGAMLMDEVAFYLYPVIRVLLALGVAWFCSTFSRYVFIGNNSQSAQMACCWLLALYGQQQQHHHHHQQQQPQRPPLTLGFFSLSLSTLFVVSTSNRNQRQFSGLLSATLAGFLTYTYLEPIFVQAGSDTAMVFLYLLVIHAVMVGTGLGVLLPKVLAGVSFACAVTIFVGAFWMPDNAVLYFPAAASVLAVLAAVGCVR